MKVVDGIKAIDEIGRIIVVQYDLLVVVVEVVARSSILRHASHHQYWNAASVRTTSNQSHNSFLNQIVSHSCYKIGIYPYVKCSPESVCIFRMRTFIPLFTLICEIVFIVKHLWLWNISSVFYFYFRKRYRGPESDKHSLAVIINVSWYFSLSAIYRADIVSHWSYRCRLAMSDAILYDLFG